MPSTSSDNPFDKDNPPPYNEATTSTTLTARSSPSPLTEHVQSVVPTIENSIAAIVASDLFAGNANLPNLVKWQTRTNDSILVRADNEEEAEVEWFGEVDSRSNQFYLFIDGGWKIDFKSTTPFRSVKARARIVKPSRNAWIPAAQHWDSILSGFRAIQNLQTTRGANRQNVIVVEDDALKIRHILFEKRTHASNVDEEVDEPPPHDQNDPFDMRNWSVHLNTDSKNELQQLIIDNDYDGNIIPAFTADPDSHLIPPAEYESCLRGALVSLRTAVTFQHLRNKTLNADNYYAEIREIKVIRPPPPAPPSPSKKRVLEARNKFNKRRNTADAV